MTLTRRAWWLLVLLGTAGLSAIAAFVAGFVPSTAELTDPLARPAALARSVTDSTATLDRLTYGIHDNHELITRQARTTVLIADHLEALVAEAEALGPLSTQAATRTGALVADARPLPGLVEVLNGHAVRASEVADRLESSTEAVTTRLRAIGAGLADVTTHLDPLAARADAIADVLRRIERDTAPLRPLGPILGALNR
jgi:hypothetical protein